MRATFEQRKNESEHIVSFSFRPERSFSFTAGQFIELTLLHHQEDGKPARRWFTISSSPHKELLTITTKVGAAAHTPFKRALAELEVGAQVEISEPMGDFVLPKLIQTPLIFVAGGIGITPFHSILEWLSNTMEERPIKLIYSVKTEDDIIFLDTFETAKQHATIIVNEASAAWGGERGRLTAEMVIGLEQPSPDTLIYISGPEPFVDSLARDLQRLGVAKQEIVLDEFQGYDGI